ncbi:MAG TPA: restriction endonuclease subunit S [Candidatus Atopostipes pullistercoris]|uniref:Restriction endonuclease subunit S n=1 Tax=Candidatus Atopostipes pullistercoris TaxID=2838467 RepID=A0A9D2G2C5_9LACT|nr:restriction endonuclease subunit S [Candidatus Atopostipes pullistercoris]
MTFLRYWERKELNNILKINSGRDYKQLNSGNIPVYGTGGYMLSVNDKLSDTDAVGIGRKGTIDKPLYLKAPFWTVDTLFYCTSKENSDVKFIYLLFQIINWKRYDESTGVPSLSKNTISNIKTYVPKIKEQDHISKLFFSLDNTLQLHERKYEELALIKKALLQKLFPKNDEVAPEVRYKNFNDAWEQRKLGEVAHIETGKLDANAMVENGKYDFYTSGIKKYRIDIPAFKGPAITIAGNGATVGYMHLADGEFNAYQRTYVLTKFLANRHFIFSEIGNKLPRKIQQESRAGNIPYIVMDMLTDLQLFLPSIAEQEKVGELLNKLNSLITLHHRKLEKLKQLKKFLLQNMFI